MLSILLPEAEAAKITRLAGLAGTTREFVKTWAEAVADKARNNAESKGGRRFWHDEVAESVKTDFSDDTAEVYSSSYIAEHVHTGGMIRPKNAKFLAIPVDRSVKGEKASEQTFPMFILRSKDPNRAFLARDMGTTQKGKARKPKILYILMRSVNQKPRPWWVTDADAEAIGAAEAEAWMAIRADEENSRE